MGDFENPILKLIIIDGYKHRVQVTLNFHQFSDLVPVSLRQIDETNKLGIKMLKID